MKKFPKQVKPGTFVLPAGSNKWQIVKEVDEMRAWVKLHNYSGEFKYHHILKYANNLLCTA